MYHEKQRSAFDPRMLKKSGTGGPLKAAGESDGQVYRYNSEKIGQKIKFKLAGGITEATGNMLLIITVSSKCSRNSKTCVIVPSGQLRRYRTESYTTK